MITKNSAGADTNSIAAVNNGSGNQKIDNSTTHYHSNGFVNLAATANGVIAFDPSLIREVIITIDKSMTQIGKNSVDFTAIDLEEKNRLNNLSQEFYDEIISMYYEPYFHELEIFLKQRENEDLQGKVLNIVENLNKKIIIKRKKFGPFEDLLDEIENALLENEFETLKGKGEIISLFMYYLYSSCLIGKKTDKEKLC